MEGMQSACQAELYRNVSLREERDGSPSIAEQIENIACINNCSSAGRCEKGMYAFYSVLQIVNAKLSMALVCGRKLFHQY